MNEKIKFWLLLILLAASILLAWYVSHLAANSLVP